MNETINSARLVADSGMFILIWLVQLIIYPAFRSIETGVFQDWHRRYMKIISFFVIPLMLVQVMCIILQIIEIPDPADFVALGAVMVAWLVTFVVSAPSHQRLQREGREEYLIGRLIRTNRLRTAGWTLAWLLGICS